VDLERDNPAARLMQRLQDYAIYCPNTPTLRGIVPDQQSRSPVGLSGGQLAEGVAALKSIQELDAGSEAIKSYDWETGDEALRPEASDLEASASEIILDELLELIDWVADIETTDYGSKLLSPKVPRNRLILKFSDRFMRQRRNDLTAYDASEGALYVLFAAVLCLTDKAPSTFAIDTLDQALNPRLLKALISKLAGWLRFSKSNRQLLFTAHNPAALDGLDLLDPEVRLFAVERNSNGQTVLNRLTLTPDRIELNQEYPLSRLWLMGHLGAVPNV
ncbi:MAG: ATP-binding protein, partial [Cyanothece sp. SIO2G6]|nr:ATP-binding protein [Cyanothece sp. SIO2G6]